LNASIKCHFRVQLNPKLSLGSIDKCLTVWPDAQPEQRTIGQQAIL